MKNPMTMNYEVDNSCVCHFLLCNVNMYLIVIEVVFRSYSTAILRFHPGKSLLESELSPFPLQLQSYSRICKNKKKILC